MVEFVSRHERRRYAPLAESEGAPEHGSPSNAPGVTPIAGTVTLAIGSD